MLFVGDDWAEGHHDIEIMAADGKKLCATRLPEGIQQLHALIADRIDGEPDQVLVATETDRGPWVTALVAAGYRVFAINPRQAARFRERFALMRSCGRPCARCGAHNAALRHVANRLVGILHGCLATRTIYDEATA